MELNPQRVSDVGHVGSFSLQPDVANVGRAIGCGRQELACIRCVLQSAPARATDYVTQLP